MQVIEKSTSEIGLHLDETPAYRHLDLCVEQKSIAYLTCAYTYGVKCVPGPARGERGGAWFGDVSFSSTAGGVSPCALGRIQPIRWVIPRMSKADKLKEEIGWLKAVFALLVATDTSYVTTQA